MGRQNDLKLFTKFSNSDDLVEKIDYVYEADGCLINHESIANLTFNGTLT